MAFFALLWKARTIERYKLNYEQEKINSIVMGNTQVEQTLSQRWRYYRYDTRKRISRTFKKWYPEGSSVANLWRNLRTDQTFPNFLMKSVMGFVGGIVLTYLCFMFFVFQLSISLVHATIMSSIIGVLLTLGLAFSYRIRCLVFLLIPQFFSRVGRYTLTCYALVLILTGPATNTLKNSEELSESMACSQEHIKTSLHQLNDIHKKPINALKDTIKLMVERFEGITADLKEVVVKFNRLVLSIVGVIQSTLPWLQSIADICNAELSPYDHCTNLIEEGLNKCEANFGPKVGVMCNVAYIAQVACLSMKPVKGFCYVDDVMNEAILAAVKRRLRNFINHLKSLFHLKIHITHSRSLTNSSRSASQVAAGIVTEIRKRADPLLTWLSWSSCVTSLFLLLIIFRAKYYQHMYETRSRFDNRYITQELQDLDLKRQRQGKDTVLPLNRREREKYITTSSFRLVASEKVYLNRSAVFMTITTFKLLIHMVADYSLYWVLMTIRFHGKLQSELLSGIPHTGAYVTGEGFVAKLFGSILDTLNIPLSMPAPSPMACLPDPYPPDFRRYTQIGVLIFLLWFFALFEPYGLRLRHVVMGHYRPERAKARATWLYNHILKTRAGFMKYARRKLHREYKYSTNTDLTIRKWLDDHIPFQCLKFILGVGPREPHCLLCSITYNDDKPEMRLTRCETPKCPGVFCPSCFAEIGQLCTICLSPSDYGDFSDVSLEKGSSDDDESDDELKEIRTVNENTKLITYTSSKSYRRRDMKFQARSDDFGPSDALFTRNYNTNHFNEENDTITEINQNKLCNNEFFFNFLTNNKVIERDINNNYTDNNYLATEIGTQTYEVKSRSVVTNTERLSQSLKYLSIPKHRIKEHINKQKQNKSYLYGHRFKNIKKHVINFLAIVINTHFREYHKFKKKYNNISSKTIVHTFKAIVTTLKNFTKTTEQTNIPQNSNNESADQNNSNNNDVIEREPKDDNCKNTKKNKNKKNKKENKKDKQKKNEIAKTNETIEKKAPTTKRKKFNRIFCFRSAKQQKSRCNTQNPNETSIANHKTRKKLIYCPGQKKSHGNSIRHEMAHTRNYRILTFLAELDWSNRDLHNQLENKREVCNLENIGPVPTRYFNRNKIVGMVQIQNLPINPPTLFPRNESNLCVCMDHTSICCRHMTSSNRILALLSKQRVYAKKALDSLRNKVYGVINKPNSSTQKLLKREPDMNKESIESLSKHVSYSPGTIELDQELCQAPTADVLYRNAKYLIDDLTGTSTNCSANYEEALVAAMRGESGFIVSSDTYYQDKSRKKKPRCECVNVDDIKNKLHEMQESIHKQKKIKNSVDAIRNLCSSIFGATCTENNCPHIDKNKTDLNQAANPGITVEVIPRPNNQIAATTSEMGADSDQQANSANTNLTSDTSAVDSGSITTLNAQEIKLLDKICGKLKKRKESKKAKQIKPKKKKEWPLKLCTKKSSKSKFKKPSVKSKSIQTAKLVCKKDEILVTNPLSDTADEEVLVIPVKSDVAIQVKLTPDTVCQKIPKEKSSTYPPCRQCPRRAKGQKCPLCESSQDGNPCAPCPPRTDGKKNQDTVGQEHTYPDSVHSGHDRHISGHHDFAHHDPIHRDAARTDLARHNAEHPDHIRHDFNHPDHIGHDPKHPDHIRHDFNHPDHIRHDPKHSDAVHRDTTPRHPNRQESAIHTTIHDRLDPSYFNSFDQYSKEPAPGIYEDVTIHGNSVGIQVKIHPGIHTKSTQTLALNHENYSNNRNPKDNSIQVEWRPCVCTCATQHRESSEATSQDSDTESSNRYHRDDVVGDMQVDKQISARFDPMEPKWRKCRLLENSLCFVDKTKDVRTTHETFPMDLKVQKHCQTDIQMNRHKCDCTTATDDWSPIIQRKEKNKIEQEKRKGVNKLEKRRYDGMGSQDKTRNIGITTETAVLRSKTKILPKGIFPDADALTPYRYMLQSQIHNSHLPQKTHGTMIELLNLKPDSMHDGRSMDSLKNPREKAKWFEEYNRFWKKISSRKHTHAAPENTECRYHDTYNKNRHPTKQFTSKNN